MSPRTAGLPGNPSPDEVLDAMKLLGNKVNVRIVQYLVGASPADFGQIKTGTGIAQSTLTTHLRDLEAIGVITGNLPAERRPGRSTLYALDADRVKSLAQLHVDYMLTDVDDDPGA
jgi:DNA-binding transcriptional ArsR family regulator